MAVSKEATGTEGRPEDMSTNVEVWTIADLEHALRSEGVQKTTGHMKGPEVWITVKGKLVESVDGIPTQDHGHEFTVSAPSMLEAYQEALHRLNPRKYRNPKEPRGPVAMRNG